MGAFCTASPKKGLRAGRGAGDMADMADLGQELWRACIDGERTEAESLLNEGANIEHEGQWGRTPIVAASEKGHLIVVKMLHGRGANVHVQDNRGTNALMRAALKGHADIATFLVTECGVNINDIDNTMFSGLHLAAVKTSLASPLSLHPTMQTLTFSPMLD